MACRAFVRAFVRAWSEHQVESRPQSGENGRNRDFKKNCRGDFEILHFATSKMQNLLIYAETMMTLTQFVTLGQFMVKCMNSPWRTHGELRFVTLGQETWCADMHQSRVGCHGD